MGSLQEQLLQAGLVDEKQLEKAKQKKKPTKHKKKSKATQKKRASTPAAQKNKQIAKQTEPAKPSSGNTSDAIADKALRVEIKKLLRAHKLNDKTGEIPYNYVVNNQVKRFYLNPEQQKSLTAGELAIVNWNNRTYLIPSSIIEQLESLHKGVEIYQVKSDKKPTTDDDYAGYDIPDDLTW